MTPGPEEWFEAILQSVDSPIEGCPTFPADSIQQLYVGRSGRAAIEEVIPFARQIIPHVGDDAIVLDFGAGWGRIARLFQEKVRPDNLILADVSPQALDLCRDHNVAGKTVLLHAAESTLPLSDASIDIAYCYSVFSHLSEDAALKWLLEINRVLKPGSRFFFTVLGQRYLNLVTACRNKWLPNDIERQIGAQLGNNPTAMKDKYLRGDFVFKGSDSGDALTSDFYGWAAMPIDWFTRKLGQSFEVRNVIDDPGQFEQVVVEVERKP